MRVNSNYYMYVSDDAAQYTDYIFIHNIFFDTIKFWKINDQLIDKAAWTCLIISCVKVL